MRAARPRTPSPRRRPGVRPTAAVLLACAAALASSPVADADAPFPQDEGANYGKILERGREEATPGFQEALSRVGTENLREALDEAREDPERTFAANVCATGVSACAGDPRLYDWERRGAGQVRRVRFTARNGATLAGRVWRTASGPATRPAIVIVPGSVQAPEQLYWFAAQTLAKAGYVVLTFDAQGQGRSDLGGEGPDALEGVPAQTTGTPFFDGAQDALDFLLSTPARPYVPRRSRSTGTDHSAKQRRRVAAGLATAANPFAATVDPTRVGIAGHSYGAFGSSWVGQQDPRVKAIVAWDNLCVPTDAPRNLLLSNPEAVPYVLPAECVEGGRLPRPAITKPALGIAGDYVLAPAPYALAPDPLAKSTASRAYSARGVDTGQLVIRGGTHYEFSYLPLQAFPATARGIDLTAWYTTAWFDKYVKGDPTADARLLTDRWRDDAPGRAVDGAGDGNLLSRRYRSRLDVRRAGSDARVRCEDLRAGCPALVGDDGVSRPWSFLSTVQAREGTPVTPSCVSRRRVRVAIPRRRGLRATRVTVRVGTGPARRLPRTARRATVDLRGRPAGRVRVVLEVRGVRDGRTTAVRRVRTFRTCGRG